MSKNEPTPIELASGIQVLCRIRKLRELLASKKVVRILEAHNGLSGLIVEKTKVKRGKEEVEFDGIWESSLTDSVSKGKPDTSVVDMTSRIERIHEILEVTLKPIVVDADNGGTIEHFGFTVRTMERIGVSAVIIEDKTGEKRNSLFGTDVKQEQDEVEHFSEKIRFGKSRQITKDFMIIARIESLILKKGMSDALQRAKSYILAGADGIMIHSKEKSPDEILQFAKEYKKFAKKVPLVVVPTTYDTISEEELAEAGVKIVIYGNHLLRSAYPAMVRTAELILLNGRAKGTSEICMPISEILTLIPFA